MAGNILLLDIANTCVFDLVITKDDQVKFVQKNSQKQLIRKTILFLTCLGWSFLDVLCF